MKIFNKNFGFLRVSKKTEEIAPKQQEKVKEKTQN